MRDFFTRTLKNITPISKTLLDNYVCVIFSFLFYY